jgi:2-methylisocitrate lyase-like PEP mutase family enzyme
MTGVPSPGLARTPAVASAPSGVSAAAAAARLRELHRPGDPLVLPNVWDAGSARIVAATGFPAVATSSAAVAESLGYADGEAMPVEEMLDAIARIVRASDIPVTADFERGYGLPPAELVARLFAAGAVGCNLEDSDPSTGALIDATEQAAVLAAVRDRAGANLVINARIDVYVRDTLPAAERLAEVVRRARLYAAAGVDCVYPIMMSAPDDIRTVVAESGVAVNVLASPRSPTVAALAALGVARISFGAGIHRAMQGYVADTVRAIAAWRSAGP